ncbi:MAG: hypothetical protein Q9217_007099, partial [Psora testacea]
SKLSLSEDVSALEAGAAKSKLRLGLFSYPVLQAADVLLYGYEASHLPSQRPLITSSTTHVPVGDDQVQHLEFTRDCADAFNAIHAPAKRVMSLKEPHLKMSKSHNDSRSRINIDESAQDIAKKIRLALTDSIAGITYHPETRPGVSNLLELMSSFDNQSRTAIQLAQSCNAMSMREFKANVIMTVTNGLTCIRERYQHFMTTISPDYLEDLADDGAAKARKQAGETMTKVRETIGLY